MESNRVLSAIAILFFTLCAGIGFGVFALGSIGVEIPLLANAGTPRGGTFVLNFVLLLVATILSQVFSFWVAKATRKKVFRFFNHQWLPKQGTAETYTTEYGERLEKVALASFLGTVVWKLATQTVPVAFLISIILGGLVMIVSGYANLPPIVFGPLIVLATNLVILSTSYWVQEWKRRYQKLVVFSTRIFYTNVRTPLSALIFGIGNLPKASETPMSEIKDDQVAADPQDYSANFKTSWLRDLYTSWLSKKNNIRTLFLRSKTNEAEDIVVWIDHGSGVKKLLTELKRKASQLSTEQSYIDRETLNLRMGDSYDVNWSRHRTEEEARLFAERYKQISDTPKIYDLYWVEDPGLYDDDGNAVPVEVIESEEEDESINVSRFFRSSQKRHRDLDFSDDNNSDED